MKRLLLSSYPEIGDDSNDVRTLQIRLQEFGFRPGSVDGKYGEKTKAAVIAFQKATLSGRTLQDGSCGVSTLEALQLYVGPVPKETEYRFITQDVPGKQQRKIQPALRRKLEEYIFPHGTIPKSLLDRDPQVFACLVMEALESMKIREVGGNNMGKDVALIQSVVGGVTAGGDGLAWCESLWQVIVAFTEDCFGVESPVPSGEGVTDVYSRAEKIKGLTTQECEVGTCAHAQVDGSWQGHAMPVRQVLPGNAMATFEGNTNSAGSRDGHGAFFKTRDQRRNDGKTTLGFVRIYPHNVVPAAQAGQGVTA